MEHLLAKLSYLQLFVRVEKVLTKVATYVFKVDEIILYNDEKLTKRNYDDLRLNVKFQRKVVTAM